MGEKSEPRKGKERVSIRKFLQKLQRRMTPHPARFHGDLQGKTGITNFHKPLATFLEDVKEPALILDLGSGNRNFTLPQKIVIKFDLHFADEPDVQGNAHKLPFKEGIFDAVILQQVLEHVVDPLVVLEEVKRILKPGGVAWIEVPFIYPVHDQHDYWRWTQAGLDLMCSRFFQRRQAGVIMGSGSSMSVLIRFSLCRLLSRGNQFAFGILWTLIGWGTFWMKYLDELLFATNSPLMEDVAASVYFLGEKHI